MHRAPSIFGSNIHPFLENAFPEVASIGLIGFIYLIELKKIGRRSNEILLPIALG
jgi:hypothetical protein